MVARRLSAPAPSLPESFGRYRVTSMIGRGAMGVVYRARDPLLDRDVALKVIKTSLLDEEERSEYLGRFMREAQAAARCAHRGIIAVYDFSENDGSPFIVMEFVEGPDLRRVMRESGLLAPAQAVPIMMQILDALDHAHRLGIVHRDIKPPNILVPQAGEVKITDFGIARLGAVHATQAGVVVGTPQYMAPEQARAEAVDLRADLFSAAAVFWEMISGKPPFPGATQAEILSQVLYGEPQAALPSTPVHAALFATLKRALAKNPADRFASASEFAAALRQAASGAVPMMPAAETGFGASLDDDDHTILAPAAPSLDPAIVELAEKELASFIGPLAKIFVKKAAATARSAGDLYQALAPNITKESDRARFLRRVAPGSVAADTTGSRGSSGRSGSSTGSVGTAGSPAVTSEVQNAAQSALTLFLGPIAKVLVRQAAGQSRNQDEFVDRLLAHLTREEDRNTFRRQVYQRRDPKL